MQEEIPKEILKEKFRLALNRGDHKTAAKIAIYGSLQRPFFAEHFTEQLLEAAYTMKFKHCVVCGASPGSNFIVCRVCECVRSSNERMIDLYLEGYPNGR